MGTGGVGALGACGGWAGGFGVGGAVALASSSPNGNFNGTCWTTLSTNLFKLKPNISLRSSKKLQASSHTTRADNVASLNRRANADAASFLLVANNDLLAYLPPLLQRQLLQDAVL